MPIFKIRVTMKNDLETTTNELLGIYQDGRIKYKEQNDAIAIFNYDKMQLKRKDKKSRHICDFKKGDISVFYNEIGQKINIKEEKIKIKKNGINFEIKYKIKDDIDNKILVYRIEELK